jgi:hypothetical protein
MGFWIFMLLICLLIPATMVGFGTYFVKSGGPKDINPVFGYRSRMSMKNRETWAFAHLHCGRLWRVLGLVTLILSCAAMLFALGKEIDAIGGLGGAICVIQIPVMLIPVVMTERALKKSFDSDGNRL